MTQHPISWYVHELRDDLPANTFTPVPSRLLWLALHLAILAGGITAIGLGIGGIWLALALIPIMGISIAGATFVPHETLHGAVVRNRTVRSVVGWLGFLPFMVSPRLWTAWHNKVHHGHTGKPGVDPDAYPSLSQYKASPVVRAVTDRFSLRHSSPTGFLSLILGFTVQAAQMLVGGRKLGLSRREHVKAWLETGLAAALWTTVAVLLGPLPFLLAFVAPLLIGNSIVMAFILTNHSLSPQTETNDPLLNSLSVSNPWFIDLVTLNFGLHVEHHLLPAMSSARAPALRDLLVARWPERYQSMPFGRALWRLARTARVYEDATTLIDPPSGRRFPTILPRDVVVPPEELTPVPAATPAATDSAPLLTPPLLPVPPR